MSTQNGITIEHLEALAAELEQEDAQERARLQRLIRAYARILAVREPDTFEAQATEYSDEEGYSDSSYPPSKELKDFSGPRLLVIDEWEHSEIATESGFYHSWRAALAGPGLYVARDGRFYSVDVKGSGEYKSFAAWPGTSDVMISVTWSAREMSEVQTEDIRRAEKTLREKAFPLVAQFQLGRPAQD